MIGDDNMRERKYKLKNMDDKSKEVIYACKDVVSDYVCFIMVFIKAYKGKYAQLNEIDTDYDAYYTLFADSLGKALGTGEVDSKYEEALITEVSNGIKNIMQDHDTTKLLMQYKKQSIQYCLQIFDKLLENAKERGKN